MNQKNNNKGKSTQLEIYPKDFRKSFFVLKTEITELEMGFLRNQITKRTTFPVKDDDSIFRIGNDFLIWFLSAITPDLSNFGLVLSETIKAKIKQKADLLNN